MRSATEDKKTIRTLLIIGDSNSDRGEYLSVNRFATKLLSILGQLRVTPQNRFTNGFVWVDHLAAKIINHSDIDELKKEGHTSSDIADDVLINDRKVRARVSQYRLDDQHKISYRGKEVVRSYAEAGLCYYDYYKKFSIFKPERLFLNYLPYKVSDILRDDVNDERPLQAIQETLVIVGGGSNDLLLATHPTDKNYELKVHNALDSLVQNINKLILGGYMNFMLFNTPEASVAPRFIHNENAIVIKNAGQYFNEQLSILYHDLPIHFPECKFTYFDLHAEFQIIHDNPEQYNFDPAKVDLAYINSPDFVPIKNVCEPQPAPGYFYYDDVHITTKGHDALSNAIQRKIESEFHLLLSDETPALESMKP